ncbi:3-isopropylmalate dehydratase small subunit [bacterium]|nr:3-isopropylmalate dehydratase small subunit [bacterium]
MVIKGYARRLPIDDDINTDYIISGRYKFQTEDISQMARHIFEDLDPHFYEKVKEGDIIVAGKNFGCGSSREQAPRALKAAGISCVVAKSFARIFYRNSFNIGLPLIEVDTDIIEDGEPLEVDLDKGVITLLKKGEQISFNPIPQFMQKLLQDGGLVPHLLKYKGFAMEE